MINPDVEKVFSICLTIFGIVFFSLLFSCSSHIHDNNTKVNLEKIKAGCK